MAKFGKQKFHSLGAAAVDDDDTDLDVEDIDLEGEDELDGEEEDTEEEDTDEEESDDDDGEEEDEPAPKSSRSQDRIRALAKQRRDLEAQNLAQKQELDKLRAQTNQPRQNGENDPQAIQAWLNTLKPEERQIAELRIQMKHHSQSMQIAQFNMQDNSDRNAYDARAANNPVYRKYAAQVEQKLLELRNNQGLNAPREEILKHIIGERVLRIKGKPVTKGKAGKSVDKHTVKSNAKKSDVGTGSRKGKTPKERLEGVRF